MLNVKKQEDHPGPYEAASTEWTGGQAGSGVGAEWAVT